MRERFETDGGLHHVFNEVVIEVEGLDASQHAEIVRECFDSVFG